MINWKCNEEKLGWRISAVLPLADGVEITSQVLIPRVLMSDAAVLGSIADMTRSITVSRAEL